LQERISIKIRTYALESEKLFIMRLLLFSFFLGLTLSGFAQPNSGYLTFDGDSSEVAINLQNSWGNSDKTIEFFFETCANNSSLNKIGLLIFPAEGIGINLTVNSAGNAANLEISKATNPAFSDVYTANIYRHGNWNHFAICYKSADSTISLFFNGDQLGTSDSLKISSNRILLGGKAGGYFKGNVDELRISDSCLYSSNYAIPSNFSVDAKTDNLFSFNTKLANETFISTGKNIDSAFALNGAYGVDEIGVTQDTSICTGDSLKLAATGGSLFKWTSKNFVTSDSIPNPTLIASISDTLNVRISNKNGCSINKNIKLLIETPSIINLGNDTTVCAGILVQLDAGKHSTYVWSSAQTDSAIFSPSGLVWVRVGNQKGCLRMDTINILEFLKPTLELGPDTLLQQGFTMSIGVTAVFASYKWSTGETSPTILATLPLTYSLTVTDTNGCTAKDNITLNYPPESIEESASKVVRFYPNPTNGTFKLVLNIKGEQAINVTVFSLLGEAVYKTTLATKTSHIVLPEHLENGNYFIRVAGQKINETLPIILTR
jgi:hypothetical protein